MLLCQCDADTILQRGTFFRSLTSTGGAASEEGFKNIPKTEIKTIGFLPEEIHAAVMPEAVIGGTLVGSQSTS